MAKEQWERQTILGYGDVPDKNVCAQCFSDYAIRGFIRENADENRCDYCDNESDKPIAVALIEVVDFICEGISSEWEDPAECMGYESREGGYQGATVYHGYELIKGEIEELFETNEAVLEDIACSMIGHLWCQRDPYGLREEEVLSLGWEEFADQVKYKSRYIFFRINDEERRRYDSDMIPVSKMLDRMSDLLSVLDEDLGLIKRLEPNTLIFRARIHNKDNIVASAKDIGTAKSEDAKYSNRMSPAGIPMFYGSFEQETAIKEVTNEGKSKTGKVLTVGTFNILRPMEVLDLTQLPEVPSIFDQDRNYLRSSLIFMHHFVRELSKPIIKDGYEHIEYIPTQVFTEYIRYLFTSSSGSSIQGILYPSSRHEKGISCVLFIKNQQCCDDADEDTDSDGLIKYLLLTNVEEKNLD